jgi:peptidoglycan/LPS O-acetylase OafA/YrhL
MAAVYNMPFREDINAIRAYAVACVVLFHFKVAAFSGGFIGVDVFFVVSGYLMTGILSRALAAQTYSYASFMWARVRRIVPGLLAMLALSAALASWLTPPMAFATYGQDLGAAALFLSNISLWRSTGYFGEQTDFNWMLHTWSLSLEWQFYMLLPLAMASLYRLGLRRQGMLISLGAACAASFALAVYACDPYPGAAFYLLPCRGWELLAGSLLAVYQGIYQGVGQGVSQAAGQAGTTAPSAPTRRATYGVKMGWLVLMLSPLALGHLPWPSAWTLIPVAATLLALAGGPGAIAAWQRHTVVRQVGLCSYSIYLFHWPVRVALTHLGLEGQPAAVLAGIGLSGALGYAGYRFIELPGRHWFGSVDRNGGLAACLKLGAGMGVVALAGLLIVRLEGLPRRFSDDVARLESFKNGANPRQPECLNGVQTELKLTHCVYGRSNKVGLFVWGDSHGDSLMPAFEEAVDTGVEFAGHAGCAPLVGPGIGNARCRTYSQMAYDYIRRAPASQPVVMAGRWSSYLEPSQGLPSNPVARLIEQWRGHDAQQRQAFLSALENTLCTLAQTRAVYVVRPWAEMDEPVPVRAALAAARGQPFDGEAIEAVEAEQAQRHQAINTALDGLAQRCQLTLLDPNPYLCRNGLCPSGVQGMPMYVDRDHLSLIGSALLVPMLKDGLARSMDRAGATATAMGAE